MELSTTTWKAAHSGLRAVCLHGITGNSASWWRVAEHLNTQGFTVTAPDLRGHGNSGRPTTGYRLDELVADVVETVGVDTDLLIGHSFGGTIALHGIHTGVISAAMTVLEDPVIRLDRHHAHTVAETEINWIPTSVESLTLEEPAWLPRDIAGRVLAHYQMDPNAVRLAWTANAPWDQTALLPHTATLTKLRAIVPTRSPYIDVQLLDLLISVLGKTAVNQIKSGHSVHREHFHVFVEAVDRWLTEFQR